MSVKISDLTAKGSAIAATDLVEISEVSGGGYVSKRVTGANILANAVPYTGATGTVDLGSNSLYAGEGAFDLAGNTDTLTVSHGSGSGVGLKINKAGNNEALYVNKTAGSGNAATVIGTLEATTLVKTGGTSTEFLMADGSTSTAVQSIMYGNPNDVIPAGLTRYYGFSDVVESTAELNRRIIVPRACTFSKFYIFTSNAQPATGSYVITILKNGVATSITVTIPAGSLAGQYTDLVNSESFAAGDGISIQVVNNSAVNSANIVSVSILYV